MGAGPPRCWWETPRPWNCRRRSAGDPWSGASRPNLSQRGSWTACCGRRCARRRPGTPGARAGSSWRGHSRRRCTSTPRPTSDGGRTTRTGTKACAAPRSCCWPTRRRRRTSPATARPTSRRRGSARAWRPGRSPTGTAMPPSASWRCCSRRSTPASAAACSGRSGARTSWRAASGSPTAGGCSAPCARPSRRPRPPLRLVGPGEPDDLRAHPQGSLGLIPGSRRRLLGQARARALPASAPWPTGDPRAGSGTSPPVSPRSARPRRSARPGARWCGPGRGRRRTRFSPGTVKSLGMSKRASRSSIPSSSAATMSGVTRLDPAWSFVRFSGAVATSAIST